MGKLFGRIIFHVGDIKSGTTSVQVALAAGCIPETKQRVVYPARGLNHNYLQEAISRGGDTLITEVGRLVRLMKAKAPADICVISGERLSTMKAQVLKDAIETHFSGLADDYSVIRYVRPHFERLISGYAEQVKIGAETRSLEEFVNRAIQTKRYAQSHRHKVWRDAFDGRYILRPMIRKQLIGGDVVRDFFQTIMGPLPEDWQSPENANESLAPEALELIREIQRHLEGQPTMLRHAIGYEFARLYGQHCAGDAGAKLWLPLTQAQAFFDKHQEDAATLDAELFGGRPLFLPALHAGLERARETPSPRPDLPPAQTVTAILGHLLSRLLVAENPKAIALRLRNDRYKNFIAQARASVGISRPQGRKGRKV